MPCEIVNMRVQTMPSSEAFTTETLSWERAMSKFHLILVLFREAPKTRIHSCPNVEFAIIALNYVMEAFKTRTWYFLGKVPPLP